MQNIMVQDSMRRDSFEEIFRLMHCADSRKEKKTIQVKRPLSIGQYNQYMGGTDLMDKNQNRYRISLCGKKWWWCLFTWLIDVALQNAWILHKKSGVILSQLEFRLDIVQTYLITYRNL